jgi:hypothetical protein
MKLEDYDEATGNAGKAAILVRDVVVRTPPVTHVILRGIWFRSGFSRKMDP